MERSIRIRAVGALNELIEDGPTELERALPVGATTKSLAEGVGVPHTEIDGLRLDGRWVDLEARPEPGSLLELHPWEEPRRVPPEARLSRDGRGPPRFVLDVHLGSLMRRLRLAGFDVRFDSTMDDEALARLTAAESRVLLTKDRKLLMRKLIERGCLIRSSHLDDQLSQVFRRFGLARWLRPLTRCVRCNGVIEPVAKASILHLLEPGTRREFEEFFACTACGRVFWKGAHYQSLVEQIEALRTLGDREGGGS
jgi:uncharacterized protein